MPPPKLQTCPACNYSLQGLPDQYRCPECGFEYDRSTEVFRQIDRTLILEVLAAVSIIVATFVVMLMGRTIEPWKLAVWWSVAVIPGAAAAWRLYTGQRNVAILSQAGVTTIEPGEEPKHLAWSEVAKIRQSGFDYSVRFDSHDGRKLLSLETKCFGARKRTAKFVESAKAWHRKSKQA